MKKPVAFTPIGIMFFLLVLSSSCISQELSYSLETRYGIFKCHLSDTGIIGDLLKICDIEISTISKELDIQIDNSITIEIYSNQEDYNYSIMNPLYKNSPAISGNLKIQMVSPLSALFAENKVGPISYHDKLYFLIHEYVHILIDKLENAPPLYLDEGIACFYSSRDIYLAAAEKYVRQINYIPTIEQLTNNYHTLPAPDLFSFLFIDFMVKTQGSSIITKLLREPGCRTDRGWKEYISQYYKN